MLLRTIAAHVVLLAVATFPEQVWDGYEDVSAVSVKVIDPKAESFNAITPTLFDKRTVGQQPLVVADEARILQITAIMERLSCRRIDEGADLRYRWTFHRSNRDAVILYASPNGKIWTKQHYWRCSEPKWLAQAWAAAGGRSDRAPSYVPSDDQVGASPSPARMASERPLEISYKVAVASVAVTACIAALIFARSKRSGRRRRRP